MTPACPNVRCACSKGHVPEIRELFVGQVAVEPGPFAAADTAAREMQLAVHVGLKKRSARDPTKLALLPLLKKGTQLPLQK